MTDDLVTETVSAIAAAVGPERDEILREMDDRADRESFPTVGPQVGGWLTLLARAVDAERIFEFGSGFGYSAYWFARALDSDGEVVLTEIDADKLDSAREYFDRGGIADRARFEHGDAIDIVQTYDGPFDVVLLDNEKDRYVEAFEAVRGNLREGSLVLADNAVTADSIDAEDVHRLLAGESQPAASEASVGMADYLDHVRTAENFETSLLPLGEGVAVSVRL
jgi:predicted O-methyltransferase YrrM